MDVAGGSVGFFGKLPSHGDFVGRRLPPGVRHCLDTWLQAGLLLSKAELAASWLPTWLSSPLWRFMLAPGVCGEEAWAGVMMPSHDQVGRCFPLLLAAGTGSIPSPRECIEVHGAWFARLEALALSTLEPGFALRDFDRALLAMEDAAPASLSGPGALAVRGPDGGAVALLADGPAPALADSLPAGGSAWWTDGSEQVASCLAVFTGLPPPQVFAAFLDGHWDRQNCQVLGGNDSNF